MANGSAAPGTAGPVGFVAVYGTLKASAALHIADRGLRDEAARLRALLGVPRGACRIPGRLLDLGAWPGLVEGSDGSDGGVAAELFELPATGREHCLAALDRFEDFDPLVPERSLYLRRALRLREPPVTAWVYVYNGPRDGARPVDCWPAP